MFPTDQPSAASTLPAPSSPGPTGFFTNGNPASGTPATILDADFLNMLMLELINVVTAAGFTPSKTQYNQVLTSIKRLVQTKTVLADTGTSNAYTVTNAPALTALPSSGFIQVVSIANANTGASTYAPDGLAAKPILGMGLAALQGGELPAKGIATLLYVVAPNVNSGNGAWVLIECTGGAQQVPPATAPGQAVQFGQVSGVVGQSRNAKISTGATATSTVTFTADEVIVESALGGLRYCLASVNKTINLASVGAGGMDTGTAPTSGFVGLYLIYNPITFASALLGVNATLATAPEVYGGANMPSGYTASALVAILPTNSSGQFLGSVYLRNRSVSFFGVNVLSTNTISATYLSLNIGSAVPRNATKCSGTLATVGTTNNTVQVITVAVDAGGVGARSLSGPTIISPSGCSSSFSIDVVTPQTLYYATVVAGSGTPTFTVNVSNYEF